MGRTGSNVRTTSSVVLQREQSITDRPGATQTEAPHEGHGAQNESRALTTSATVRGNGIAISPSLQSIALKAPNWAARGGETISGNLGRASDGEFTNAGGGSSATTPKPAGSKPRKPRKKRDPKQTPEQRAAERETERTQAAQEKRQEQSANRATVAGEIGLNPNTMEALDEFASPDEKITLSPANAAELEKRGLVERSEDGEHRMTVAGRQVLRAAEAGDARAASDALSRGTDRTTQRGQRETARQERTAAREQKKREREAARLAKQQEKPKKSGGGGGGGSKPEKPKKPTPSLADALARMRANAELLTGQRKSFTVFKDARGRQRWLLVSSNAYEDRDREIVSIQALTDAVALADTTKTRGPLRWWHVPGVELGDCDYQAVAGRHLLESGTFRSEAIGARVALKANDLRASIGFHHPANEPDAAGVFHHIAIFERSLVPVGRAANPWTRLVVTKEKTMLTEDKKAQLKELLGDEALLASVLENLNQTDKTATAQGTRFKDDEAVRALIREEITEALKAWPPKKATDEEAEVAVAEETPPAEIEDKAAVPVEEMAAVEGEAEMDYGPSFTPEEMAEIAQAIAPVVAQAVLAELGPVLDLETKMRGYADEVKGLFTAQQRTKDDADEVRAQQLETLRQQVSQQQATLKEAQDKLAELMGEQPRSSGYRASTDPNTVIPEGDARLKELAPQQGPFADIYNNLFGQATPVP